LGKIKAGLVSGFWAFTILVAVFGVVLNVPVVKGDSGTIYIRADGSIDPSDAPISTVDYVTYTLTGNITSDTDGIVIERSSIIIDGNGYTVQGSGYMGNYGSGFYVSGINNVTIKRTNIQGGFTYGVYLESSSYNTISENNITNNQMAVLSPSGSYNNTISGNNIFNNWGGVSLPGPYNNVSANSITDNDGYGVTLSGSYNTISGNMIINNYGYELGTAYPKGVGLLLYGSNNTLSRNCLKNSVGVWFYGSNDNKIFHNNFMNKVTQVYVTGGSANVIDDGYPSGGNYWVDHNGFDLFSGPYQNVTGSDQIGDAPYVLDANNQDRYPLTYHWSPIPSNFSYIKPDGSIDPQTAPINRVGDLYELTSNVLGSIVVQRNGIIVDGRGYTVQGTEAQYSAPGIDLSYRSNVTIRTAEIQGFENGVAVRGIGEVTIERNKIFGNSESGILIVGESNVLIKENTIIKNKNGIATDDTEAHSGIAVVGNMILSNNENGIYLSSQGEGSIYGGHSYGHISNVNISANTIALNGKNGICLDSFGAYTTSGYGDYGDSYSYICNITVFSSNVSSNRENGIYLSSYSLSSGSSGNGLSYISGVTLSCNIVLFNEKTGVRLFSSSRDSHYAYSRIFDVSLSSNNVSLSNEDGIYLESHSYWGFTDGRDSDIHDIDASLNNVLSNGGNGIYLCSSSYSVGTTNPGWGDQGQGSSHISNVRLASNNVSLNNGNGIYLYGLGYGFGYGSGFGSVYNVTLSSNTVLSNKENGIYLYGQGHSEGYSGSMGYGWGDGSVYDVAFSFNDVSLNGGDGVYVYGDGYGYGHDYGPGYGYIHHITLLSENLSLNGGNGLNLYSHGSSSSYRDAYAYGYIHNVTLISSRISSNGKTGVYSYSDSYASSYGDGYGYSYSYIYGFSLVSNTISSNNENGIYVKARDHYAESIFDLTMSDNIVYANYQKGMWIEGGINANLTCNSISHNGYGIYLSQSYNSTIFHNNFIDNTIQAYAQNSINVWDDDYPSGGNFWDDYGELDTNGDGIGDVPYIIDTDSQDRYPLTTPFGPIPIIWDEKIYPIELKSNSTIFRFRFNASERIMSFNVTGPDYTFGFCNITVPKSLIQDLWQGSYTVLLNGEPWPFRNWTDSTNTYIYINYTHSEHEIVIIPEFPSFLILPLFMMATLPVVIAYRRKRSKSFRA